MPFCGSLGLNNAVAPLPGAQCDGSHPSLLAYFTYIYIVIIRLHYVGSDHLSKGVGIGLFSRVWVILSMR